MATKQKAKIKKKEIFWYALASVIALTGLVFVVFGIIGDHLPVLASDNWVRNSEKAWLIPWLNFGYRQAGIILILIGAFIAMLALTLFAREGDRDAERNLRRAQRLAIEQEPVAEAEVVAETKGEEK